MHNLCCSGDTDMSPKNSCLQQRDSKRLCGQTCCLGTGEHPSRMVLRWRLFMALPFGLEPIKEQQQAGQGHVTPHICVTCGDGTNILLSQRGRTHL